MKELLSKLLAVELDVGAVELEGLASKPLAMASESSQRALAQSALLQCTSRPQSTLLPCRSRSWRSQFRRARGGPPSVKLSRAAYAELDVELAARRMVTLEG